MKELKEISKNIEKLLATAQAQYVESQDEITKSTLNGKLIAYWQCKNYVDDAIAKLEAKEAKDAK